VLQFADAKVLKENIMKAIENLREETGLFVAFTRGKCIKRDPKTGRVIETLPRAVVLSLTPMGVERMFDIPIDSYPRHYGLRVKSMLEPSGYAKDLAHNANRYELEGRRYLNALRQCESAREVDAVYSKEMGPLERACADADYANALWGTLDDETKAWAQKAYDSVTKKGRRATEELAQLRESWEKVAPAHLRVHADRRKALAARIRLRAQKEWLEFFLEQAAADEAKVRAYVGEHVKHPVGDIRRVS